MSRRGENIYKRKDNRWEGRYIKGYDYRGKALFGYVYAKTYREVKTKLTSAKNNLDTKSASFKKDFNYFCDEWLLLSRNRVRESTYTKYYNITVKHIKKNLGNYLPFNLNTVIIEEFSNELLIGGLSPKPIFDNNKWEPGFVVAKILRVTNNGSLALRWTAKLVTEDQLSDLADVIDVYVKVGADAIPQGRDLTGYTKVGNIREFANSIASTTNGTLEAGKSATLGLALKMREEAGNAYQGLDLCGEFDIQIYATQYTFEEDSFDNKYDADAAWDGTASYNWYVEGLNTGVYAINNASDLAGLANIVNGTATTADMTSGIATYGTTNTSEAVVDTLKGKTVTLNANIDLANKEWTPIGNSTNKFEGNFDGKDFTISNLYVSGRNNYVGLFGYTTSGSVKNLKVNNSSVSGRVGVGVISGSPYTSKFDNITITGDVFVNGMAYVGGALGRNAYANVSNITINANPGSYVNANSVENGTAYRTYVGGVIGFMGEGSHTVSNIRSNIDVIGSTVDVGGIVGIAHYNNTFENCVCTGNITITNAEEAADADEIGGIAGVWHNQTGYKVTFTNCSFTGTLKTNIDNVDLSNNNITGKAYSATGNGELIIDGKIAVQSADKLVEALENGKDVLLESDVKIDPANMSNAYGKTGINVKNGQTIDGNGFTLDIKGAGGTWDSGVNTTGGLIKNFKVTGSFRGIFINHNSTHSERVILENVTIEGTTYTISCDQGTNQGLTATNSVFNGWTSYAATIGDVKFDNCSFGEGNGYKYCRPYAPTEFVNCDFSEGYRVDAVAAVTFENCTLNGVAITAENIGTLVTNNGANATVK